MSDNRDIHNPILPLTVLIDHRETGAFPFANLPHRVETRRVDLATGDYSLAGYQTRLAVERKSLEDLIGTCRERGRRKRFEAELARLDLFEAAHVVIEATWEDLEAKLARQPRLLAAIRQHARRWQLRFRGVAWHFCDGRR